MAVVYGSLATGFACEESDMDVAIRGLCIDSRDKLSANITAFSKELERSQFVIRSQAIVTARIPIIKLVTHNLI